jgi:hypothetical protein
VWPWGVLEYQLYRSGWFRPFFGRWIYRLLSLSLISVVLYSILYGVNGAGRNAFMWAALAVIYQLSVILTAFEGIYAYIGIGNYRRHYHVGIRLADDARADSVDDMYELDILLPFVFSAIIINVFAFITAQNAWSRFAISNLPVDTHDTLLTIVQGIYYVSTTMTTVGYGDIVPKNYWGYLVATLMQVQSLLLIAGTFSAPCHLVSKIGLRSARVTGVAKRFLAIGGDVRQQSSIFFLSRTETPRRL